MDDFARDIPRRCRWALAHNGGTPNPAWSAGERLIVALVLTDDAYIAAEGYTKAEVLSRLEGDIGGNAGAWLAYVRGALEDDDDDT